MTVKRLFAALCAGTMLLIVCSSTPAAEYYVAVAGNDTNPGTSEQPWLTLAKAVNTVAPGDTILIKPGVYAGCPSR